MALFDMNNTDRRSLAFLRLSTPPRLGPLGLLVRRLDPYGLALLGVATCSAAALLLKPYALLEDEAMIYLLGIVLIALRFDVKVSLFAAVVSVLSYDFFFIPPVFAFALSDAKRTLTFVGMIVVGAVVSGLNERLRHQERAARRTALEREALYQLNVEMSVAATARQLAGATARQLERLFGVATVVMLRTAEGALESPPDHLLPEEAALAERAWSTGEHCSGSRVRGYATWMPIAGIHEPLGVIGLRVREPMQKDSEDANLVVACARELAMALEKMHLAGAMHRSQLEAETERMRSSLLSAVSHDLKTPLANIVAAGSTLLTHGDGVSPGTRDELLSDIVGEGERLTRLVQNLLSVTRLESPTIQLKLSAEPIDEIVAATIDRLRPQLGARSVAVEVPADLPWVLAEPALIEQVLSNLIENAIRYAGADSPISVSAQVADGGVDVQVVDQGPGIPEEERDKVFEKFYRGSPARADEGGAGLGLTICRAIVRAHGGKIAVRAREGGGTLVEFTLPVAQSDSFGASNTGLRQS
jgi:two-component system sensor histidine kinase KdpD